MCAYNFIGTQGRIADGGVFRNTSFGTALMNGDLNLLQPETVSGRDEPSPHIFVADDAFPLTEHICKPYSTDLITGSVKRVFNYRLSRARRVVENAFRLLSTVFRVFRSTMNVHVQMVQQVTLASDSLHNFLRRNKATGSLYSPSGIFDIEDTVGILFQDHGETRPTTERLLYQTCQEEAVVQFKIFGMFHYRTGESIMAR